VGSTGAYFAHKSNFLLSIANTFVQRELFHFGSIDLKIRHISGDSKEYTVSVHRDCLELISTPLMMSSILLQFEPDEWGLVNEENFLQVGRAFISLKCFEVVRLKSTLGFRIVKTIWTK
jgi:hypothetical protein